MLPSWIADLPRPRPAGRRHFSNYIARTLRESARFMEEAVFAERIARRQGFLQSLDARTKLLTILALLVAASFMHHIPSLWLIGAFAVLILAVSRVPMRVLFNRVWWVVPVMFLVVAIPAALSIITPGEPLVTVIRWYPPLTITRQGVASGGLLVTGIVVGLLLALSLALTTKWHDLLKAGYTSATAAFVLILAMMYRYLFVLLRIAQEMYLARSARTIAPSGIAADRAWIGSRLGSLFLRSRQLSERVYDAMLARGYTGNPRTLTRFRFGIAEGAWVLVCMLIIGFTLFCDRLVFAGWTW